MKTESKYGLIIGLAGFTWLLAEFIIGFHGKLADYHGYSSLTAVAINIIGITLSIREKRNKEFDGKISFGQGMWTGLITSIIAGLVGIVGIVIYFQLVNPDFTKDMMAHAQQAVGHDHHDPKEIMETAVSSMVYYSMNWFIIQKFFGAIISGVIISSLASVFLKKK